MIEPFYRFLGVLIAILFLTPKTTFPSFELIPLSARQEAMGGVSGGYGIPGGIWLNPASGVKVGDSWLTLTYSRLWGLPELSLWSLIYTHPFHFGNLSVGISDFGYSLYKENIYCLSFATEFYSALSSGINLKWMSRSISDELVENTASIDGGIIMNPIEKIAVEVSSHNISSPKIGVEMLHQDLLIGFVYQPQQELTLSLNLLKQSPYPIQLNLGEEYYLTEWLVQRAGVKQNPTVMTFGFGIRFPSAIFDYASLFHPTLGITHSFSINIKKFWGE